jgi:hypothetical protein
MYPVVKGLVVEVVGVLDCPVPLPDNVMIISVHVC